MSQLRFHIHVVTHSLLRGSVEGLQLCYTLSDPNGRKCPPFWNLGINVYNSDFCFLLPVTPRALCRWQCWVLLLGPELWWSAWIMPVVAKCNVWLNFLRQTFPREPIQRHALVRISSTPNYFFQLLSFKMNLLKIGLQFYTWKPLTGRVLPPRHHCYRSSTKCTCTLQLGLSFPQTFLLSYCKSS